MDAGFLSSVSWFLFWWTVVGSVVALLLATVIRRADEGEVDLDVLTDAGPLTPQPVSTRDFDFQTGYPPSYASSYRSNLSRK